MTATEQLRKLLDERGVEYLDSEDDTTNYYANSGYRYTYNVNPESGWAQLFGYHLTPEQAIAATLGSDREAQLEALAKDLYENAVDFNFKGWMPYYKARFAALGIEVEP